jgi:DNA-directed RNA polymerase subunit alpha
VKRSVQPWVKFEEIGENAGRFVFEPLKRGMGVTIGNSLRRILFSSLEGAAVVGVKIEGVDHEFSTIPHVMEDVIDIVCNLKGIVFKYYGEGVKKLTLEGSKTSEIKAKNIKTDADIEIINPDHYIATTTDKKMKLKMELLVGKGVGYVPADANRKEDQDISTINIDASFSPIVRVNHTVENIRVGKELDYDSLKLDVYTNGSMTAENAVRKSAEILIAHLVLFEELNKEPDAVKKEEKEKNSGEQKQEAALGMEIDELELSARSSNCLKKAGIATVAELIAKNPDELVEIKNFGKRSADEINNKLKQYGLSLTLAK